MKPYDRNANGEVMVGPYKLPALVERFGSPLYVYNFKNLREIYTRLRRQLHPAINLYYAIKANPNLSIVKQYIELGAGFDLSSVGELKLAFSLGGDPVRMSFAGPGKSFHELEEAIRIGVGMLSVESISELNDIEKIAKNYENSVSITLRVNPIQKTRGFQLKMGGIPSPFGIDEEKLHDIFRRVHKSKWIAIKGLHVFSGTQCLDEGAIIENTKNTLRLAKSLSQKYEMEFEVINLGGGWGVPYHEDEQNLDERKLITKTNEAINFYLEGNSHNKFIIELGRYLIASSGLYAARVIRNKESHGVQFLVLDGGMNHYLAASGNLGQVFRKNFSVVHGTKVNDSGQIRNYNIVGPLCTPIDRMATDVKLPQTVEGDILAFPLAGAYAYSASPLQFLSHPSPSEVAVDGEKVFNIRNRIENWNIMLQ